MAASPVRKPIPPRETSRWTEWIIMIAVVLIAATGMVTVLGGDVNRWWKGDSATPGDGPGKGRKGGPGKGPGPTKPEPAGPSGPAIPI